MVDHSDTCAACSAWPAARWGRVEVWYRPDGERVREFLVQICHGPHPDATHELDEACILDGCDGAHGICNLVSWVEERVSTFTTLAAHLEVV